MKTLPPIATLKEVFFNKDGKYDLTQSIDWVHDLLAELNENSEYSEEKLAKISSLDISLELERFFDPKLEQTLLVKSKIKSSYCTRCVKSLDPLQRQLDFEFKGAFVHESFQDDEAYKELTETYLKDDVYDIYYEDRGKFDFKSMIHEQLFLNYDFFPKVEEEEQS